MTKLLSVDAQNRLFARELVNGNIKQLSQLDTDEAADRAATMFTGWFALCGDAAVTYICSQGNLRIIRKLIDLKIHLDLPALCEHGHLETLKTVSVFQKPGRASAVAAQISGQVEVLRWLHATYPELKRVHKGYGRKDFTSAGLHREEMVSYLISVGLSREIFDAFHRYDVDDRMMEIHSQVLDMLSAAGCDLDTWQLERLREQNSYL